MQIKTLLEMLNMKIIVVNVLALIVFAFGIAGIFVWESRATAADKKFCEEQFNGFKSMY